MNEMSNKRIYPRIPKEVSVEVKRISYPLVNEPEKKGIGKDISEGGICFSINTFYERTTLLNLEITIKSGKPSPSAMNVSSENPIIAIGEVVWCKKDNTDKFDVGIQFIHIYEYDYRLIMKYLTETIDEIEEYKAQLVKISREGICQLCEQEAPFYDNEGIPFLEVHHVKWLSLGGEDTLDNVVLLCPNCHRKIHTLHQKKDTAILTQIALENGAR